jgi:hypothetical protein
MAADEPTLRHPPSVLGIYITLLSYRRFDNDAHELIHRHYHIPHLILSDHPITVQVVHAEGPVQLLMQRPVQQGGEGDQHVLEGMLHIRG